MLILCNAWDNTFMLMQGNHIWYTYVCEKARKLQMINEWNDRVIIMTKVRKNFFKNSTWLQKCSSRSRHVLIILPNGYTRWPRVKDSNVHVLLMAALSMQTTAEHWAENQTNKIEIDERVWESHWLERKFYSVLLFFLWNIKYAFVCVCGSVTPSGNHVSKNCFISMHLKSNYKWVL